ncbi:MAG: di-trans,poly-cis-decaprenylcistransferase [Clostridia bacterium]|nr:di-trans,poly-cis-decaprenylcistransferase [Clostridia bacterium]MBR2449335.1 di-trans,poly-cis-decaprenylcistransferase [Clostridia bacterium]
METVNVPSHVGIIMDGNGRWATAKGQKRSYGHKHGSANVDNIVTHAFKRGVKSLTLYAFSAENWARPKEEVDELMKLLKAYLKKFAKKLYKNDVRLIVIGGREELSEDLRKAISEVEEKSKDNKSNILNIAINYGGRQEIVNAVKRLIEKGEEITVNGISENLYTSLSGDPDLIIRTGGELRLSNFLLYQGAYSELYFTDVLWPDFNEIEFDKAMEEFGHRKRRFGKV